MMIVTSTGAANVAVLSPAEAQLVAAYGAADDGTRVDLVVIAESLARASPRIRCHLLTLVHSSDSRGTR